MTWKLELELKFLCFFLLQESLNYFWCQSNLIGFEEPELKFKSKIRTWAWARVFAFLFIARTIELFSTPRITRLCLKNPNSSLGPNYRHELELRFFKPNQAILSIKSSSTILAKIKTKKISSNFYSWFFLYKPPRYF